MSLRILKIKSRQVFDARGNPTVEAEVHLDDGTVERATVPSGASVGKYEAFELRDTSSLSYRGKGVSQAVSNVNNVIASKLTGINANIGQQNIDNILIELDGSRNKKNLGANAILAVSLAFAKASAKAKSQPLFLYIANEFGYSSKNFKIPTPMLNIINGGQHADNNLDIQEFMIVPLGGNNMVENLRIANEITYNLRDILIQSNLSVNVGDEGGFAPGIKHTLGALSVLRDAISRSGYREKVKVAMDVAASEFWVNGMYNFEGNHLNSRQLLDFYQKLLGEYGEIVSIEDPFAEQDIEGWKIGTKELGERIILVGDDLFVTNVEKLSEGFKNKTANSILIKPNQIGTLTETISAIKLAADNGYIPIISHRSGETEDTSIAHLAVSVGAPYIKTGALCRGERVAKYNELLRIEETMNI